MPEISTGYAVKNNAESTVADNPLTSNATTLNVAAGQGSRFPSPPAPFLITIWDDVTHPDPTDDPNMEIAECSARSSDALTIARGKEDTSGVEHANGSRVAMLITAGIFNDPTYGISTKLNGIEDNATADQTKADIDALGINADQVDGHDAGNEIGDVFMIPNFTNTGILYQMWYGAVTAMQAGDEGKQLTSHGQDSPLTWETPSGSGDMLKSVYDTNNDSIVDDADKVDGCNAGTANNDVWKIQNGLTTGQIPIGTAGGVGVLVAGADGHLLTAHGAGNNLTWTPPYSHPSTPACQAATSSVAGHATSTQISKLDGIEAGATSDQTKADIDALGINADQVDGCDTGITKGNVYKLGNYDVGVMMFYKSDILGHMAPGTSGYQLTSQGSGNNLTWSASSDLIFSDTHCPKCGKKFEDGEILVLYIAGHNEIGDILTIPMHKECAESSKKTITIKRKVMENQYILDELTGKTKIQRVRKMQKKTVTKKRMKKDVELDGKTGEFWQIEDEKRKKKITADDATEEYEEEIDEQIYENIEFEI